MAVSLLFGVSNQRIGESGLRKKTMEGAKTKLDRDPKRPTPRRTRTMSNQCLDPRQNQRFKRHMTNGVNDDEGYPPGAEEGQKRGGDAECGPWSNIGARVNGGGGRM